MIQTLVNMDDVTMNSLYVLMVLLAAIVLRTAGECEIGSKVTSIPFSATLVNHTIVGTVMSSITSINERTCERQCFLAIPDLCYMFNYYPSSKVCQLLYKDRAAEYKVEKKYGSTFKTRKCLSNPCNKGIECYSLGVQNNTFCFHNAIKANTDPVCTGAKDNSYGTFFAPANGNIQTFNLVHISGGVSSYDKYPEGKWGSLTKYGAPSKLELHITDENNSRITPPEGYSIGTDNGRLAYVVEGFSNMSPELVFPDISPPLAAIKGKEFRIWFGQDLKNVDEKENKGTTCADVYVYYTN